MKALQPIEFDLSTTPGTYALGSIPFIEGVIADLAITGTIEFGSDPNARPIHWTGSLDAAGIGVDTRNCHAYAKLLFSNGIELMGGPCTLPRTMVDATDRKLVSGTITAVRGPLPITDTWCGPNMTLGACVYTATGSHHISIKPLAGELAFKGSYNGKSGEAVFLPFTSSTQYFMVRFQEFTNPAGLTIKPLKRTWKQGDPSLPGNRTGIIECPNGNYQGSPPTYPGLVCDIYVKETGMMTSLSRVNGVEHSDTAFVYCLDTALYLNSASVRRQLEELLPKSGVPDKPNTLRFELGFFILEDTVAHTEPCVWILPKQADADACGMGDIRNTPRLSARPPGTKLHAWGHDHVVPVDSSANPPASSVYFCFDSDMNVELDSLGQPALRQSLAGPSPYDWEITFERNQPSDSAYVGPIVHYIPTPDGDTWVLRPGKMPGAALTLPGGNVKWFKRQGYCAWPKRGP